METQFKNVNEKQLDVVFSPPPAEYEHRKHATLPVVAVKKSTRAEVMQRAYDEKRQQARQRAERSMMEEDLRNQELFRETKMRLLDGNETIIRDVDALLHTEAQEKQLQKEKTFIDYEMNTFIPIHAQIEEDVEARYTSEYVSMRRKLAEKYLIMSRKPGQNLDNIDPNQYDPFAIKNKTSRIKLDDPMERAQRLKKEEDKIISEIDRLTQDQRAEFVFEGRTLADLRAGVDKMGKKQPERERETIDPRKWAAIDQAIVIPGVSHARKRVGEIVKTQPIYIPEDE